MKAGRPWRGLLVLVLALSALPLVAAAATQPAGSEKAAAVELPQPLTREAMSQGVLAMEDSAMLVKAKFTAKPGEQFLIRREVYQRIKQAFDEAGIRFAHRQVTVFVPPSAGLSTPVAAAAGGAAAVAATEPPAGSAP